MIHPSTKLRYGLRAMVDISLQPHDRPVLVQSIAERQNVSRKYLDQLLAQLRGAGLVRSIRGSRGGYLLARPPEEITVEEIAAALDGAPTLLECVGDGSACARSEFCIAIDFWRDLSELISDKMKKTTLAELARMDGEKRSAGSDMYYI
jgi:Rrf2 family protein